MNPIGKALQHVDVLGAGARKRAPLGKKNTRKAVMAEFGRGTLYSGSGHKVTDPKQAAAIAYAEARKKKKA